MLPVVSCQSSATGTSCVPSTVAAVLSVISTSPLITGTISTAGITSVTGTTSTSGTMSSTENTSLTATTSTFATTSISGTTSTGTMSSNGTTSTIGTTSSKANTSSIATTSTAGTTAIGTTSTASTSISGTTTIGTTGTISPTATTSTAGTTAIGTTSITGTISPTTTTSTAAITTIGTTSTFGTIPTTGTTSTTETITFMHPSSTSTGTASAGTTSTTENVSTSVTTLSFDSNGSDPSCAASTELQAHPTHSNTAEYRIEVIVPTVEELLKDQRNLPCTVPGCGKILATPPALKMHLNKSHAVYENPQERSLFMQRHGSSSDSSIPIKKQYYCPATGCPRSLSARKPFPKISLLKQHYVGIHAEKKFQCSKCPARFGMEKLRIKHEETCGVIYDCGTCDCGYTCTTRHALISHVKYRKHQLPPDFLMRPIKQRQKELQTLQEQRLKQGRQEQRKYQRQIVKQIAKRVIDEHSQHLQQMKREPLPILPKLPVSGTHPMPVLSYAMPKLTVSQSTQTTPVRRKRGPYKKSVPNKTLKKTISVQDGMCEMPTQACASVQCMTPLSDSIQDGQTYQDSGVNTSLISASHIETQTSVGGYQSTHTCTQTQGDVIVRNALLLANIETQTTCSNARLVQSSTQYSNMYSAASAETQTACPNLSLHQGALFQLEAISGVSTSQTMSQVSTSQTMSQVSTAHPAVQTQTSATNVASSDAQTDNWLSALYESPTNNSPGSDSPTSALTQPADVPTQTDLSFLEMLNFSHSETQTMNSLASFMMESSSTQTPLSTPRSSSYSNATANLQSTEAQTHMAGSSPLQSTEAQTHMAGSSPLQSTEAQTQMGGLIESLPLNTSQTQTSIADLCLGDVFLSESQSQTSPGVSLTLDESLSSSHQQTQTGSLWNQSTQTAAEKELDAALSLLNQYTQTSQTNLRNDSPRPDSLSELEFTSMTSMHTQTMEDVLAVLDSDNQSTSVQTDFDSFAGHHRSFGVSTENQQVSTSGMTSNSGVAVQTDTLDLSSFQDLDFYSNSSSSSQTS